ncbi:MAG: M20/M25/M40 family metallo-hydrolase [Campylobacterales bacterium]|nr:M20/M25/M40 family metallo-hydrolase [Campylobacterales bacterium]
MAVIVSKADKSAQVIEIFQMLCTIAHCSGEASAMLAFLQAEALRCGYKTQSDSARNLLCSRAGSRVTLQAHYDMVCIGDAPKIECYEQEGWLRAKESSLGADNGIAVAMMIALMREGAAVDLLFTADEEIGLLGARALHVRLKTPYMLNLDSESEGVVTVGCAGGVDIIAELPISYTSSCVPTQTLHVSDLPGGHSGIDIDKQIPNALQELLRQPFEGALIELRGGERRNAIPRSAFARLACTQGDAQMCRRIDQSDTILAMLRGAAHGVIAYAPDGSVETSINLAMVETLEASLRVHLSARSMRRDALLELLERTRAYYGAYGCTVHDEGWYDPWEVEAGAWRDHVAACVAAELGSVHVETIHAGLECGVIKTRYPHIQMASIGPDIVAPHSIREKVNIASIGRVFACVRRIIAL